MPCTLSAITCTPGIVALLLSQVPGGNPTSGIPIAQCMASSLAHARQECVATILTTNGNTAFVDLLQSWLAVIARWCAEGADHAPSKSCPARWNAAVGREELTMSGHPRQSRCQECMPPTAPADAMPSSPQHRVQRSRVWTVHAPACRTDSRGLARAHIIRQGRACRVRDHPVHCPLKACRAQQVCGAEMRTLSGTAKA